MAPFEYTPFNPAPYAASVGELLARSGEAQAHAAIAIGQATARQREISGQAWAGAIQNLAQIPGQIVHAQAVKKETDSLAALRQSEIDRNTQDLQARQRGVVGQQLLGKLTEQYSTADPVTGIRDTNHDAIATELTKAGYGDEAQRYLHGAASTAEDVEKIKAGKRAAATATAESIGRAAQTAGSPDAFLATLDHLTVAGALDAGTRTQFAHEVEQAGPDGWAAVKKRYVDWADSIVKPITVKDGDTVTNAVSGTPRITGTPRLKTSAELAADAANPASPTQAQSATALDLLRPPKPEPAPKGYQHVDKLLDGKPATLLLDPTPGGKLYDLSGAPIDNAAARVRPIPPASTIINPAAVTDIKEAVAAMKDGTAPPLLPGRATKEYLATIAEAHRQGFDIQGAVTDWTATQKHIATMNGAQQLRLNQAINALPEMLDKVDALASQWKGGRFPVLNKANLALAKGGAYGKEVASVATQLDAQIADVTADLGNVYMGGNSPTDHALGLAGKSLNGAWDESVLHDMVKLAKANVTIRSNSIKNTGVAGASDSNRYGAPPPPAAAATSAVPSNVASALKGASPGVHTLSDGSTWTIAADGSVTKGR